MTQMQQNVELSLFNAQLQFETDVFKNTTEWCGFR